MAYLDRVDALSIATERRVRSPETRENIGGLMIKKRNGKGAYGADVSELLWRNLGTYQWDMDDPRKGIEIHDNIYQCMAADIHQPGAKLGIRRDAGREYEDDIRSGVQTLARWLDEQYGIPLYRCTSSDNRRNQVVVITVHPDFVVDKETGLTAKDMQYERNIKALKGQARATVRQLSRDEGDRVRAVIKREIVGLIDSCPVDPPKRRLETSEAE